MHKQLKSVFLISIPFFVLALVQVSCKKRDVYPSQQLPKLTAVNPTAAMVGDTVVLNGSNLKDVVDVKFGTRDVTKYTAANTDTQISLIVPDSLNPGDLYVQVYLNNGTGYSATKFKILETPKVPDITSVNPTIAFPGDAITIKGINFTNVSAVTFGNLSADFTITDSTKLTVTVPSTIAGVHQLITVSAPTGSDTISFTVNYAPIVSAVTPDNAVAGDSITVKGIRFTGATSVTLGSFTTGFAIKNDSTLKFQVPAGASSGKVTVTTPNGSGTSGSSLTILVAGLAFPIYDDAVSSNWTNNGGWIGGGWGGAADYSNTTTVESGTKSVKIDYVGGYGSPLQLGHNDGDSVLVTGYTTFKISIYGGPGSNGKSVNIGINQQDAKTLTIVEGQWTDFQIPITDLTSKAYIKEIWIKEYNGTGGFTIYVDNMGLN